MANQLVQGQKYPTVVSEDSAGDFSIGGLDGIKQPGGAAASGALNFATSFNNIYATGFGFNLPAGAVIKGVEVHIKRSASQKNLGLSRYITDATLQLFNNAVLDDTGVIGVDRSDSSDIWDNTQYKTKAYGGVSDLWGATLTPAIVNSPNFGVFFQIQGDDESGGTTSANIDFISIIIYYEFATNPYSVKINNVDRTGDILSQTVKIDDAINDQVDTCSFSLIDRSGNGIPTNDQEIIIVDANGVRVFGGDVLVVQTAVKGAYVVASVQCVDYTRLFDRNLVHKAYISQTDQAIIQDIVDTYCNGLGITTSNVLSVVTINQISFNYMQPSQVMRKLTQISGQNWYIDYFKDLHYFPLTTNKTPFDIVDAGSQYKDLIIKKDASQLKNRIYVRGGTKLSDPTTFSTKGDGVMTQFVLPDKAHDVSVTVNGVAQTVGIKNVNTSGYDWYLNFEEKYLEQDTGGTILTTSDTLVVTYTYDIPILIAQENTASIAANGVHEFPIFDKTITTTDAARDRAIAELTDYANNMVDGTFSTIVSGFRSGQYININHTGHNVNADYIVQKVSAQSLGGGFFEYKITLASAKTMGIIKFLLELLEANRDLVQLDPNEVVDELFTISDALLSDSLTDMLVDSVTTPPFKWSNDPGTTTTKMVWGLFQWG